jgi:hypothetical protein
VSTPPAVLMVELIMSIDRMITSAQNAGSRPPEWLASDDEQWAPPVVLGHISQVDELVWLPRIQLMCQAQATGDPPPQFVWWEPDPAETVAKFGRQSLEDVAALAMSHRTTLLSAVKDLTPTQWQSQAKHDAFGEIDVSELLIQVLTHDEEHRASLVKARSGLRWLGRGNLDL